MLHHQGARPAVALIVAAAIVAAPSTVSMADPARDAFDPRRRCRVIAMLAEIHRNGPVDMSLMIEAPKGGGSGARCGAPARKRARRSAHSAAST